MEDVEDDVLSVFSYVTHDANRRKKLLRSRRNRKKINHPLKKISTKVFVKNLSLFSTRIQHSAAE